MPQVTIETWDNGSLVGTRQATVPVEQTNRDTLQSRAQAALAANLTYLNLASPSTAQNTAQLQRVTKECNAVIRLLLGQLDDVTGT